PLVVRIAGGGRADHDRVVTVLDVGTRLTVRPVRREVRLAAHERAEDRTRAAVREITILETAREVEAQVEEVGRLAVDVRTEAVLIVARRAVLVVAVLCLATERKVIADPLGASAQRYVAPRLE